MAKVPALPPSPLWLKAQVPEKYRPFAFLPVLFLAGFLVFAIVGLLVQEFEVALLLGLIAGPVVAWGAVGFPLTRAQVSQAMAKVPKAPPEKRPFLFFPAALIAAALLYFLIGFVITAAPLEEDLLALLALGVSIPAALAIAFLLYGFPHVERQVTEPLKRRWAQVPAEKRPLLFLPLGLLIAAPLYFVIGFAFTEVLEPDVAVLLGLVLGLVLGFAAAYKLVGVPRTTMLRERVEQLPKVPERAKPAAFLAFVIVVGTLIAVVLGGTVGSLEFLSSEAAVDLAFPLFLIAGWLLAVPLAGRLFGYPVPSKPLPQYLPRLTAEQRPAALLPLTLGLGLALTFVLGMLLGLAPTYDLEDVALAAAIAFPLALLVSLRVLGVSARELDPRGLERIPERAKPLATLALWLFLGTLLFALVGQVLTGFVEAVVLSYAAGFVVALALVDHPTRPGARRAARRRKAKEIEARLRVEMGLAEEAKPATANGGRFPRLGRRGKA